MDPALASSFIQEAELTLRTIRSYVLAGGLQLDTSGSSPDPSIRKVRNGGQPRLFPGRRRLCALEDEFVVCSESEGRGMTPSAVMCLTWSQTPKRGSEARDASEDQILTQPNSSSSPSVVWAIPAVKCTNRTTASRSRRLSK